jgi:uncharacterized protein YwqG
MIIPQPVLDLPGMESALADIDRSELAALGTDSPASVVLRKALRERVQATHAGAFAHLAPCDQMLLARGTALQPYHTCVNGLPYRPKEEPWPKDDSGHPMAFLAQVCFTDSRDIVGNTPGDVMLLFVETHAGRLIHKTGRRRLHLTANKETLLIEWQKADINAKDLMSIDDCPSDGIVFPKCYGVRHRDWEASDDQANVQAISDTLDANIFAENDFRRKLQMRKICHSSRFKIGGVPFWYYDTQVPADNCFLGSFAGVNPIWDMPFPWCNQQQPIPLFGSRGNDVYLDFADGFILNFFLDKEGKTTWEAQFT